MALNIKKEFSTMEWMILVEMLASAYFDEDGTYTPHIGEINDFRVFYNECVLDDVNGVSHDIQSPQDIDKIIHDKELSKAYSDALFAYNEEELLTFGSAHSHAMDIVYDRQNIRGFIVEKIKKLKTLLSEVLTEENLEALNGIVDALKSGDISLDDLTNK